MTRLIQTTFFLIVLGTANADQYCSQNWYGGCDDRGCGGRCQRVGLGDCICGALGTLGTLGTFGTLGAGLALPGQPISPVVTSSVESFFGCISSGNNGCVNNGGCNGQCFNAGIVPNNICQCRTTTFNNYVNQGYGGYGAYGGGYGLGRAGGGGCVSSGFNGCVSEGCLGRCVNSGIPPNNICYCEYGYGNGYGLGRK